MSPSYKPESYLPTVEKTVYATQPIAAKPDNYSLSKETKKIRKPKPWKHSEAITRAQLMKMREEFWDTAPHYGGQKGSQRGHHSLEVPVQASKMASINTNADSSQQFIDDHQLDKVVQDFNEFREKISQSSLSDDMKLEDLIDLYINNSGESPHNTSQPIQDQFTALLEDFNMFESMLPSDQVESSSNNGFNIDTDIQESEMMIKEMSENTSQSATESFSADSQTVSMNRVTYIRHGERNYCGTGADIFGSVFGGGSEIISDSVMKYFKRGMKFCQQVSRNGNANRSSSTRKRVKRKYRGVIETDEETKLRLERTKIKNREAAAKTHADRKAHEAYTLTQLSKLRRKNGFLKKLVTFQEPPKRTISAPQEIGHL
ncbi:hypothetical protein BUALT_Bualt03G0093900 [Buddleja alternifolia]|uniref:DC-UbP/UBTD2 N-terminal domain-containing protein n=1 Tax=Buddleja alternifolia TaxID=168488 RepID=A0AAV6Y0S1_9LAMI|nr:hypothetical protein BUALT_Bualt03G0093900 [Buddleja alternifolia]